MLKLSGKPRRLPVRALRWISSAGVCGVLAISGWTSTPLAADDLSPVRLRPAAAVTIAPPPAQEQDAAPVQQDNTPRIDIEPAPAEEETPEEQPLRRGQEPPVPTDSQVILLSGEQPTRSDSSPQPSPTARSRSAFGWPAPQREPGPAALPATQSGGRGLLQKLFAGPAVPPAAIASPAEDHRDRDGQEVVNALFHREAPRRSPGNAMGQRHAAQRRSAGPVRLSLSDREIRQAEADQDRVASQDTPRTPAGTSAAEKPAAKRPAGRHTSPLDAKQDVDPPPKYADKEPRSTDSNIANPLRQPTARRKPLQKKQGHAALPRDARQAANAAPSADELQQARRRHGSRAARAAGTLSALNAHNGPLPPYRMNLDRRAEPNSKRVEN